MREPVASSRPGGIGGLRNAGRQTVVAGGRLICPRSRPATQGSRMTAGAFLQTPPAPPGSGPGGGLTERMA